MGFAQKHDIWVVKIDECDSEVIFYVGQKSETFGHLAKVRFYPAQL